MNTIKGICIKGILSQKINIVTDNIKYILTNNIKAHEKYIVTNNMKVSCHEQYKGLFPLLYTIYIVTENIKYIVTNNIKAHEQYIVIYKGLSSRTI